MNLTKRLDRLESKQGRIIWHVHYISEPGWDPRKDCEKCAALSDAEYAAMRDNPGVRIVTVEDYEDPIE